MSQQSMLCEFTLSGCLAMLRGQCKYVPLVHVIRDFVPHSITEPPAAWGYSSRRRAIIGQDKHICHDWRTRRPPASSKPRKPSHGFPDESDESRIPSPCAVTCPKIHSQRSKSLWRLGESHGARMFGLHLITAQKSC